MNRASSIKATSIAENCRSILRERSRNHTGGFGTFPQQGCPPNTWKPCHPIPTNPFYSLYGVDNLRVPVVRCEEPPYCNTLSGLSPTIPFNNYVRHRNCIDRNTGPQAISNRQTNHVQHVSASSENCIQMITNAIITKIRSKIPQKEIALLCCCLPSLIRQIMCKSPSLTPNDIIQCLSADIIKEAMNCSDQVDQNVTNDFHKPKQDHHLEERPSQQRKDNQLEDNHSMESRENGNDSLSSYQSTTSANSQQSFLSEQSTRAGLDLPTNIQRKPSQEKTNKNREKRNETRTPSTRSFTSQQSKDRVSGSHHSLTPSSWTGIDNKSNKSNMATPVHIEEKEEGEEEEEEGGGEEEEEEDQRSIVTPNKDPYLSVNSIDSNEDFDEKILDFSPKPEPVPQLSRIHIEYPGKKDPNVTADVEKCLAFYQKIREYFDDDVAAMLLKCCLCYGDCSGKR